MTKKSKSFLRSFLISTLIFSIIAALTITCAYFAAVAVDPQNKKEMLLVAFADDNGDMISITAVKTDPKANAVELVPIPDNTILRDETVLQSLYKDHGIERICSEVEALISDSISRYLVFTPEKLSSLVEAMGEFEYSINYPFEYKNEELAGTVLINGDMVSSMLSYKEYDLTSVSYSKIGSSFLQSFLSKYANDECAELLLKSIVSGGYCESKYTNVSEAEMKDFVALFSRYSSMAHRTTELEGEYNITSARIYFVPKNN